MATGILPWEFAFETKSGNISVAIPRFLLRKENKNTVIRFAVVWSYVILPLFIPH